MVIGLRRAETAGETNALEGWGARSGLNGRVAARTRVACTGKTSRRWSVRRERRVVSPSCSAHVVGSRLLHALITRPTSFNLCAACATELSSGTDCQTSWPFFRFYRGNWSGPSTTFILGYRANRSDFVSNLGFSCPMANEHTNAIHVRYLPMTIPPVRLSFPEILLELRAYEWHSISISVVLSCRSQYNSHNKHSFTRVSVIFHEPVVF